MLVHYVQSEGSEVDLVRVSDFFDIAYALRMNILLGTARETVDECEITFLYSLGGDMEVFFRTVRYIVL